MVILEHRRPYDRVRLVGLTRRRPPALRQEEYGAETGQAPDVEHNIGRMDGDTPVEVKTAPDARLTGEQSPTDTLGQTRATGRRSICEALIYEI